MQSVAGMTSPLGVTKSPPRAKYLEPSQRAYVTHGIPQRSRKVLSKSGSAPALPPLSTPLPARETEEQMIREASQYRMGEWVGKHDVEKIRCASTAMAAEMRLRQALVFTDDKE